MPRKREWASRKEYMKHWNSRQKTEKVEMNYGATVRRPATAEEYYDSYWNEYITKKVVVEVPRRIA